MTPDLLEILLNQNESESLDFKSGQYAFEGVDAARKGELLKDILAFANAWRQTDAYILIGVEEGRDARSVVVGVDRHLLNRSLQQFVNEKTNRPVSFSYSSINFEDKEVGVLHIPIQDRPIFLRSDFGKLRGNVVYIRRGDTTAEASPDDVLRMVSTNGLVHRGQPALGIEYADPKTRERWGQSPVLSVASISVPSASRIPDYGGAAYGGFSLAALSNENRDLFRDTARFLSDYFFLSAVGVAVDNTGTSLAEDVRLKITIPAAVVTVRSEREMPKQPTSDGFLSRMPSPPVPSSTAVLRFGAEYEVTIEIGNVQPGTTAWAADPFFIGARQDTEVPATVQISANNLRVPITVPCKFKIRVDKSEVTVAQVKDVAQSFVR